MNTLFDRDMSINNQGDNMMGDQMQLHSMGNMNQSMPSNYFNQNISGDMTSNLQRNQNNQQSKESLSCQERKMDHKVGDIYLYEVKRGDNLYSISRVFGSEVDLIVCMNHLEQPTMIHPGMKILVPVVYKENKPMPIQPRQNYGMFF